MSNEQIILFNIAFASISLNVIFLKLRKHNLTDIKIKKCSKKCGCKSKKVEKL